MSKDSRSIQRSIKKSQRAVKKEWDRSGTRIRQPRKRNVKTGNTRRTGCVVTAFVFTLSAATVVIAIKGGVS